MRTKYSETVPIQYEEGRARFMDMEIAVDPRVFIPRPETELLVSVAAGLLREKAFKNALILDICTGSGIVALGVAGLIDDCRVVAADISEDALDVAKKNLEKFDGDGRIRLVRSDMFSAFGCGDKGVFDAIVSNPPYVSEGDYAGLDEWVKAEPVIALHAGKEGMDHLEILVGQGACYLKSGGLLAVEVGYDQAGRVISLFEGCGFGGVESYRDFNGFQRVVAGWKNG